MNEHEKNTLENILTAAKAEFLKKGFRGASLRNIVKTANLTTGAFYGYYKSKEELFDALVSTPASYIMDEFYRTQNDFKMLSPNEQEENMSKISGNKMLAWIDYLFENADAFKLILKCSEGTKYENFIHDMVSIEIEATHKFTDTMNKNGKIVKTADPNLEHILISGFFTAYFDIVIDNMPREQAKNYVLQLCEFQTAGWSKIMGL